MEHYREDAARILDAAANDTDGYDALTYLCGRIGNRSSGTPQLNTAVQWSAELMRKAGLENAAGEDAALGCVGRKRRPSLCQ
jgi:hypothetical protein